MTGSSELVATRRQVAYQREVFGVVTLGCGFFWQRWWDLQPETMHKTKKGRLFMLMSMFLFSCVEQVCYPKMLEIFLC